MFQNMCDKLLCGSDNYFVHFLSTSAMVIMWVVWISLKATKLYGARNPCLSKSSKWHGKKYKAFEYGMWNHQEWKSISVQAAELVIGMWCTCTSNLTVWIMHKFLSCQQKDCRPPQVHFLGLTLSHHWYCWIS